MPSYLTYPLGAAGLVQGWFAAPDDILLRAAGAIAGYAMLAVIAELYRRRRGVDGSVSATRSCWEQAGAWIGLEGLPSALLIGSSLP